MGEDKVCGEARRWVGREDVRRNDKRRTTTMREWQEGGGRVEAGLSGL